ncbi:hypothetical protein MKW92_006271 [Papaver armeniacum]|nr:hypothetical protein MKW92_006271 [Papaver armeniacum]
MIFTIASFYVCKPVSCVTTIFAIPRLSKRILITFLYASPLMIFAYLSNLANIYLFVNVIAKMNDANAIAVVFAIIYGLFVAYIDVYITVLWNLANVIAVLEPRIHAFSTMKMSIQLLRGNPYDDAFHSVSLYLIVSLVILFIENLAVFIDYDNYIIARILLAFCVIIMAGVNFVGLIGQSVLYYACKTYHNQVIDKEVLYAHLAGKESGNREV